jgi:DNA-binding beta-propeller fold protein YncE
MIVMSVLSAQAFAAEAPPTFVLKWGEEGTGDGQFLTPWGAAVDNRGNVYVADYENHRIQKFDRHGNLVLKWGEHGTGDGQLFHPRNVAVDSRGRIYVADMGNHRIQKFDAKGNLLLKFGEEGSGDGQFGYVYGVAVDHPGYIYVSDYDPTFRSRVQKFDRDGNFVLKFGSYCDLVHGTGCIDPDGEGPLELGDGQFTLPAAVAASPLGHVYVADTANHRILKFDRNGNFVLKWGSHGTGDGQFVRPMGIAIDERLNVYVSDTEDYGGSGLASHRVQKFYDDVEFLLSWGGPGSDDGQFDWPVAVALARQRYIYVVDSDNHRIQKFSLR